MLPFKPINMVDQSWIVIFFIKPCDDFYSLCPNQCWATIRNKNIPWWFIRKYIPILFIKDEKKKSNLEGINGSMESWYNFVNEKSQVNELGRLNDILHTKILWHC